MDRFIRHLQSATGPDRCSLAGPAVLRALAIGITSISGGAFRADRHRPLSVDRSHGPSVRMSKNASSQPGSWVPACTLANRFTI